MRPVARSLPPRLCAAVLGLLSITQAACGQSGNGPVTKAQALKAVLSAVSGWRETVSDEGRFRVLFPGEPQVDDNVISVKGLRLVSEQTKWVASYSDLAQAPAADAEHLRNVYRDGVVALTVNGQQLLQQRDVFLHGRLGTEFVIVSPGTVTYMRSFLTGQRLYTLAVDQKREINGDATIPSEVKQFFASFTYWDSL